MQIYTNEYENLKKGIDSLDKEQISQINKDIDRTFPKDPYFGWDRPGWELLKELL